VLKTWILTHSVGVLLHLEKSQASVHFTGGWRPLFFRLRKEVRGQGEQGGGAGSEVEMAELCFTKKSMQRPLQAFSSQFVQILEGSSPKDLSIIATCEGLLPLIK
jgi:hypothetical protein